MKASSSSQMSEGFSENGSSFEDDEYSTGYSSRTSSDFDDPALLAAEENQRVRISKWVVILVLMISVTLIAAATFVFTTRAQHEDFESKFEDAASEVVKVSQLNMENVLHAAQSLSLGMSSFAVGTGATWPFVTMPLLDASRNLVSDSISVHPLVTDEIRGQWERYSVQSPWWKSFANDGATNDDVTPYIYRTIRDDTTGEIISKVEDTMPPFEGYYAPVWQSVPPQPDIINWNRMESDHFRHLFSKLTEKQIAVLGAPTIDEFVSKTPFSTLVQPVFGAFKSLELVAVISAVLHWNTFFETILQPGTKGIVMVLEYGCDENQKNEFSFLIEGPDVTYLGLGDASNDKFDYVQYIGDDWTNVAECPISVRLSPSKEFRDEYVQRYTPYLYTAAVLVIFLLTAFVFLIYDRFVQKRQTKVVTTAVRSGALVHSLFPSHVRDRVLKQAAGEDPDEQSNFLGFPVIPGGQHQGRPIADLHPHTTVLMGDLVGFTAWSSVREPAQVFTLLETIYAAFDKLARHRRVFKVETIGDCYVAVTGLPDPRPDHALVMCRFAHVCAKKVRELVPHLERTMGPDTADLGMRFGLHSGPVTAGVLRGEKARFQLFGDTVNIASRMERYGQINKIQLSNETAELVRKANKGRWLVPRADKVHANKGLGASQTFWLDINRSTTKNTKPDALSLPESAPNKESLEDVPINIRQSADDESNGSDGFLSKLTGDPTNKSERLIDWNVDVLTRLLQKIVAMRGGSTGIGHRNGARNLMVEMNNSETVLDEVREIITLPSQAGKYKVDPNTVQLSGEVVSQLRDYVSAIASMYRENPFHNFEHAAHVTQSLTKLLSRIVTSDSIDYEDMCYKTKAASTELHDNTFGITSDPLTHFACAFSAMIHDVDHPGVPNTRLINEEMELAKMYKNKSIAEQNSVDIAWELLMEPGFAELREVIYTNQDELDRFRQLVVNSVMATDIVDKELGQLRKNRWNKAFNIIDNNNNNDTTNGNDKDKMISKMDEVNRKATIVIEHLIQAADVAHTMQHWHVYLKWNERFFCELYQAYLDGRADKDPSIGWYQGEIGFFDFYIIPLATKLEKCGVFGVSSDECLEYAKANRNEWERKGKDIVARYLTNFQNNNNHAEHSATDTASTSS